MKVHHDYIITIRKYDESDWGWWKCRHLGRCRWALDIGRWAIICEYVEYGR